MLARIPRALRIGWRLLVATVEAWYADHASLMAAALALYSLISIAPLLILVLAAASAIWGPHQVQENVTAGLAVLLGEAAAEFLDALIGRAAREGSGFTATVLGAGVVLYGSTRVFAELQRALRAVWRSPEQTPEGFRFLQYLGHHLFSFALVLGAGLLWVLGMIGSTVLAVIDRWLRENVPASAGLGLAPLLHLSASVVLLAGAVSLIYRLFSEGRASWRDVWPGSLLTALLLALGQKVIGAYLGQSMSRSVYGIAGSAIVVVFFFYYSWMIFFLGAEFTKVWATERRRIRAGVTPPTSP